MTDNSNNWTTLSLKAAMAAGISYIAELADLAVRAAADLFGYRGKVVLGRSTELDYLIDNPNRRCPAIDKARSQLGFDPKVSIEDGMYRSLIWYGHNRTAAEG